MNEGARFGMCFGVGLAGLWIVASAAGGTLMTGDFSTDPRTQKMGSCHFLMFR
jgi:hypothetical protein